MTIGPTNSSGLRAALAQVGSGKTYDTLHMTAGQYNIDNSVSKASGINPAVIGVNNGSTVYGDMDANGSPMVIWKLMNDAPVDLFACQYPILGPISTPGTDLEIYGIEFNGNAYPDGATTQTPMTGAYYCPGSHTPASDGVTKTYGKGYHNFLGDSSRGFSRCKFHNIYVHDSAGDGIRVFTKSNDVEVYSVTVVRCGHCAIMFSRSSNINVHDCTVSTRSNGALRYETCTDSKVKNMTIIGTTLNYNPGFQIEDTCKNIDISGCFFYDVFGAGIDLIGNGSTGINIHHNIFKNCGIYPVGSKQPGVGGIVTTGCNANIFNNVFYGCRGYGVAVTTGQNGKIYTGTGYVITVKNNIFMNTAAAYYPGTGSGSAIANLLNTTHTINQSYNCFYGNVANLKNVATDTNSVLADPQFANVAGNDFHLKSTHGRYSSGSWIIDSVDSPCIDKGDPTSDYSLETAGNGQRINIGRYGGTAEASRTTIGSTGGGGGGDDDPDPPNPPSSGGTYYIAQVTGKDYYCNPANTDHQAQINAAGLAASTSSAYDVVCLVGSDDSENPVVYTISDKVWCYSGTRITADGYVKVKLKTNAAWAALIPMFAQAVAAGIFDFEIDSFEIDGNADNQSGIGYAADYYNGIYFRNVNNIKVHDLIMHDFKNDAIRLRTGTSCTVENNEVSKAGNIGIDVIDVTYPTVKNNNVTTRINHGIRILNSNNFVVDNNTVQGYDGADAGYAGIAITSDGTKVVDAGEIVGNKVLSTYGPGIALGNQGAGSATLANAANIKIQKNIVRDCGLRDDIAYCGGIVISGWHNTTIEGNEIDSNYRYGIAFINWDTAAPLGTGYTALVRNNNIVNTKAGGSSPAGTGIGVANLVPSTHVPTVKYNCLFNNVVDLAGCTAANSVLTDPLFVDRVNFDYHLRSIYGRYLGGEWITTDIENSPCINAGDPSSSAGMESDSRIDIGIWGGTEQASKSSGTGGGGGTGGEDAPDEEEGVDPEIRNLGTEVLDGRTVVFAEYVPETSLGIIPTNPTMRTFYGDITKIVLTSGAEYDEYDILSTRTDRLCCGVAVKTVEKMHTVDIHIKPATLGLLPYALNAADTTSYSGPGTSIHPVSIGLKVGNKYAVISGCVLKSITFDFKDPKKVADCVMKFQGISKSSWSTTDYIGSGSHAGVSTAQPFKLEDITDVLYDGVSSTEKGFIFESLSFGVNNQVDPVISTSAAVNSKIVAWKYGPMELPLSVGATLTDPSTQDSILAVNAHTFSFKLYGKTFSFSSVKWGSQGDVTATPGAVIAMELVAIPKAVRLVIS